MDLKDAMRFFEEDDAQQSLKRRRIKVTLTEPQYQQAVQLAQARNKKERRFGAMTYGEVRGSLEAHVIGIVPEMAVNILGGGEIDARIFESHGDEGIDTKLPELGLCGIKTTTYGDDPYLRVEIEHFRDDIDSYILCYYDPKQPRDVWVVGWATKDEVKRGRQKCFVRGGPLNYVLFERDLRAWGESRGMGAVRGGVKIQS